MYTSRMCRRLALRSRRRARAAVVGPPRGVTCACLFFVPFCCGFWSNPPQISVYKKRHPHAHTHVIVTMSPTSLEHETAGPSQNPLGIDWLATRGVPCHSCLPQRVGWVTFVVRDWCPLTSDTDYTFLAVVVSSSKATPYLAASFILLFPLFGVGVVTRSFFWRCGLCVLVVYKTVRVFLLLA